jgi:hypothetical protein
MHYQQKTMDLWDAYRAWRVAAGLFADFVLPTPFLAGWVPVSRLPRHAQAARVVRALASRVERATAVFLEAPPRLALATGVRLSQQGWAAVPMIGRWPVRHALLPVEHLVNWLAAAPPAPQIEAGAKTGDHPLAHGATQGPSLAQADHPPVCFLLDGERDRTVSPAVLRTRFDNRYEYGSFALPPAAHLRRGGFTRVLWVGTTAGAAPDLEVYADSLAAGGLAIEFAVLTRLLHSPAFHVQGQKPKEKR